VSAPSALFSAAADALGSAGARGLILTSNDDIAGRMSAAIGAGHGVWPFVPLGPVLDRCQAVIHAGGHGTNAAVLTAGLPSAIVPAVTDQVWHARRIEQLGVGVRVKRRESRRSGPNADRRRRTSRARRRARKKAPSRERSRGGRGSRGDRDRQIAARQT